MNQWRFLLRVLMIVISAVLPAYDQTVSLEQAVGMALQKNPQLLNQSQKVKAEGALIWDHISPLNPEIFIEEEGIPESSSNIQNFEGRKIGVNQSFSMPWIYIMKGLKQNQSKKVAQAEYCQLRNRVIADVKKQFYQCLLHQKKIELYSELVDLNHDHLEKARIRVLAGEASPYDTMKAKVDWMDARNQLLAAEQESIISTKKLKLLIGADSSSDISIKGQLIFQLISLDFDTLYTTATLSHPLARKAYAELKQKRIRRSMTWMELIPDIHIKYFKQSFGGETSHSAWGGGVGIEVPLWFLTKNQGNIRHAQYQLGAKEIQYAAQQKEITLGIDQAIAEMKVSEKQVFNYEKHALQEVKELVRIAKRSYEEGEMGSIEVSEALRSMIRVQIGYHEAVFRYESALADLEVAAGKSIPIQKSQEDEK